MISINFSSVILHRVVLLPPPLTSCYIIFIYLDILFLVRIYIYIYFTHLCVCVKFTSHLKQFTEQNAKAFVEITVVFFFNQTCTQPPRKYIQLQG